MAEEFEESEVIFNNNNDDDDMHNNNGEDSDLQFNCRDSKRKKLMIDDDSNSTNVDSSKISVPMSIPENVRRSSWFRYVDDDLDGGDDGEIVPPHVIVRRRVAGRVMAFSVCTGNGRTLKGRDLSEVRNSVLRMTGFLET